MSLETNLELNNQLVTRNNELLERLISTLASGVVMRPDAIAQVQEYHETVAKTKAALTLDDLEFSDVIALAAFYPVPQQITEEMLQRAVAYRDATGEARVVQIDALDSALQGVKRAKELLKPALLDLSRNILKFWDDLPTIGERRAFAERLLDAPPAGRDEVKPKKAGDKEKKERKGPFYWKHPESGAIGSVEDLGALNELLEDGLTVEINKVEFLQLQKDIAENSEAKPEAEEPDCDALRKQAEGLILQLAKGGYRAEAIAILEKQGAKKLSEVADKNLADVIAQAEKALEG